MQAIIPILIFAVWIGAAIFIFKQGGLSFLYFGSKSVRTIGEIDNGRTRQGKRTVRVHELKNGNIGIEVIKKRGSRTNLSGLAVTREEAVELVKYLTEASSQ